MGASRLEETLLASSLLARVAESAGTPLYTTRKVLRVVAHLTDGERDALIAELRRPLGVLDP